MIGAEDLPHFWLALAIGGWLVVAEGGVEAVTGHLFPIIFINKINDLPSGICTIISAKTLQVLCDALLQSIDQLSIDPQMALGTHNLLLFHHELVLGVHCHNA